MISGGFKELNLIKMIDVALKYIKEQTGLNLLPCDYFTGMRELAGEQYFNVVLNEQTSESKDFDKLKRFADKYKAIRIEPNGVKRVAIFTTEKLSH